MTLPGGILVLAAGAAAVGPSLAGAAAAKDLVLGLALGRCAARLYAQCRFRIRPLRWQGPSPGGGKRRMVHPASREHRCPLGACPLVPGSSPSTERLLVALSYAFFGMDMLLYVLVMSMLHKRVFLHPLPSPALAPSLWIGLGPIGVGSPALVKTVPASLGVLEYALGTGGEAVKPLSPGKDVGADAAQFLKLLADPTRRQILWAGGSPARG